MTNAIGVTTFFDPFIDPPPSRAIWEERIRRMNALDGILIGRGQMFKHPIVPVALKVQQLGNIVGNRYKLHGRETTLVEFSDAIDALEAHPQAGLNKRGARTVDLVLEKAGALLELYND